MAIMLSWTILLIVAPGIKYVYHLGANMYMYVNWSGSTDQTPGTCSSRDWQGQTLKLIFQNDVSHLTLTLWIL